MAHQVFISYSHLDNQIAHALCDKLEADGTKCWIAPRDIAPGKSWAGEIAGAIPRSKIMILILSKSADSSSQVLREVEIAVHHNLIIIPVRIEDIMPTGGMSYYLATMQWIDVKGDKIDSKLAMISKKVRNILSELEDDKETDEDIQADIQVDVKAEIVPSKRKSGKKTVWIIVIAVVLTAAVGLTLFLMRDTLFKQKDVSGTAPSTQTPDVTAEVKSTPAPAATSTPAPTPTPTPIPADESYISDLLLTVKSPTSLRVSWTELNDTAKKFIYTVSYKAADELKYESENTVLSFRILDSLVPSTQYLVQVSTEEGNAISDTITMPTPTPRTEYIPEDFGFDPDMAVEIPDSTLEDAIVETLDSIGAPAEGELTVADMFNLEELCISNSSRPDQVQRVIDDKIIDNDVQISTTKAVSNIEGIQYAKNLKTLIIQRDGIVNISPISELSRLQILWLGGRYIKSLDAVAGLTNISYLLITDTQYISDISAISNLENLTFLGLDWSKLTDISPIMNLSNVIDLAINNNTGLNDLSYLEGSPLIENLEGLWIPGCNISDLSFLSGAEKLRVLCLSDPSVKSDHEDISVLEDLNLDELIVSTRTYTDNIETIAKLISKGCNVSIDE